MNQTHILLARKYCFFPPLLCPKFSPPTYLLPTYFPLLIFVSPFLPPSSYLPPPTSHSITKAWEPSSGSERGNTFGGMPTTIGVGVGLSLLELEHLPLLDLELGCQCWSWSACHYWSWSSAATVGVEVLATFGAGAGLPLLELERLPLLELEVGCHYWNWSACHFWSWSWAATVGAGVGLPLLELKCLPLLELECLKLDPRETQNKSLR